MTADGSTPRHRIVAVFGSSASTPGQLDYESGIECGRLLAEHGFAVANGGYFGTMEAVSLGARGAGGQVHGVTAPGLFPTRTSGNEHLTSESQAASLSDRIGELVEATDASIALHGSLGTATELLMAWNLAYVMPMSNRRPKPVVAVGDPWTTIVPMLEAALDTPQGFVTLVPSVEEAVAAVVALLGND